PRTAWAFFVVGTAGGSLAGGSSCDPSTTATTSGPSRSCASRSPSRSGTPSPTCAPPEDAPHATFPPDEGRIYTEGHGDCSHRSSGAIRGSRPCENSSPSDPVRGPCRRSLPYRRSTTGRRTSHSNARSWHRGRRAAVERGEGGQGILRLG